MKRQYATALLRVVVGSTQNDRQAFIFAWQLEELLPTNAAASDARRGRRLGVLKDHAELTQHDVADTAFVVLRPRANQAGEHRRAQHRLFGRERIGDSHAREPGV